MRDTHPSRARSVGKPTNKPSATEPNTDSKEMTEMRDTAVPCVNATHYEVSRGMHMTWEDGRICPRCVRTLDMFAQRIAINEEESTREPVTT